MSDTTLTTADKFEPLKTDCLGRVKLKPEHREALLDAFDSSSLPATKFAEAHGVNYQTFATWLQKRKRERGEYRDATKGSPPQKLLESLVELELPGPAESSCHEETGAGNLVAEHPSGVRVQLTDLSQVELAAALFNKR